ncbi:META domain-containing protein [uncultured Winogradskyella sp.]|uniref:META domain-containing protein n=1 Tax=Winogradskyella sp. 4-2091 TaxID=3381659 RepID=UPI0026172E68|nr:META domain-containing protein [uncultured Winogradskyella sp.]
MKILLSLFMLLTTLNSCDSSKKAIENSKKMQTSLSGTYYIVNVKDMDVSSNKITINFDEASNKVTGFAGCNSFFGNYTLENNTLTFQNIGASKKFCPGTASVVERQFLKALNSVNSYSINENSISFSIDESILIKGSNVMASSKKSTATTEVNDKTAVKYVTSSKTTYNFVSISKTNVLLSNDKGLQDISTFSTDAKDWNAITELINAIDVETIQDLIPPSTSHQTDGALHASLAIIIGDIEYMTPTFDHGNPPSAIMALVNKVLSIKENTD